MKEIQRKCCKCGRSPGGDPNVKLFRFPRPGLKNTLRCELWGKYIFPDRNISTELQQKLYSEHRMLCDKHFKPSSFIDFKRVILHRSAVPEDVQRVVVDVPSPSLTFLALTDATNTIEIKMSNRYVDQDVLGSVAHDPLELGTVAGPLHPALKDAVSPSHPALDNVNVNKANPPNAPLVSNVALQNVLKLPFVKENTKDKYLMIKCRKNMQKVCQLCNRIRNYENELVLEELNTDNALNVLIKQINPSLALTLQGEIQTFRRKWRRWTKGQKIQALKIYKRSSTCYRLLQRLMCLPSPSALKKLLNQFPLTVGINTNIFQSLKKFIRTQLSKDNEYVLLFNEMSIRKHQPYKDVRIDGYQDNTIQGRSPQLVSYALVFMICGLRNQLKLPIAFYLSGSSVSADRLAVLIEEVIINCFASNINISATVCNTDAVNRTALAMLGATSYNPCIDIFSHTVITLFDPPRLLMSFRNLFLKYDVKYETNLSSEGKRTGVAKWRHIQQFFEVNNNPNFVYAPALKQEHLAPNTRQKKRFKLAAQVLSHSVAVGMYSKIAQGELPAEATVTANLIANMDKLFDCLNNNPDSRGRKPLATNLTDKTPHLQIFREMKTFFESVELLGCRNTPPSVEGWIWTLNAVELVWNSLKRRHPRIRSLSTRKLQLDPMEHLFGCIRDYCRSNTNPTAEQFTAAMKTALLNSLATASVWQQAYLRKGLLRNR